MTIMYHKLGYTCDTYSLIW